MQSPAAGGMLLTLASVAALIWSNSDQAASYRAILNYPLGPGGFAISVHRVINDGLMSLFFLFVGLEIRREITTGHLATWQKLAAPGIAALGGMILPAAIYIAVNAGNPRTRQGWAIPMATDIAFSLAVLGAFGGRLPPALRVFLTALAILDDLAAILIIAVFYAKSIDRGMLTLAFLLWLLLLVLGRSVSSWLVYLAGGVLLWLLVLRSGIHPTMAGVALACAIPGGDRDGRARPLARHLEERLAGVVACLVLPLFGLANAGLTLRLLHPATLLQPAPMGVILGLLIGKPLGVFGATMLGRAAGVLRLPSQMNPRILAGAAMLCGIGFTMSLFIAGLAFPERLLNDQVRLAVLCASFTSACLGALMLRASLAGNSP
jgi:NhaA family Na+:H+ antiporter